MNDRSLLARITSNPSVLAGKPAVRGTRLSVEFLLNLLAHGATETKILSEYEGLAAEDLAACLLFASSRHRDRFTLLPSGAGVNVNDLLATPIGDVFLEYMRDAKEEG